MPALHSPCVLGGCQTDAMRDGPTQALLAQIIQRGAPAHRDEALRLSAILERAPDDAAAHEAARQLGDAYLNDPYLERG